MAKAMLMKARWGAFVRSWGGLAAIVTTAGASGAGATMIVERLSGSNKQEASPSRQTFGDELVDAHASPEDLARAMALLRAHLGQAIDGEQLQSQHQGSAKAATVADVAPEASAQSQEGMESWESSEGESAADALARLERAYLAELQRSSEGERKRNDELQRENEQLMRDAVLARRAELDRTYELERERAFARDDAARFAAAQGRTSEEPEDVGEENDPPAPASASQYAMVSSIYAPVFIGSAPQPTPPPATKTSTASPYPTIPQGAFLAVTVPQSNGSASPGSSSNQAQFSMSYRPGPKTSPWAPIDMSKHNNPWATTPVRR